VLYCHAARDAKRRFAYDPLIDRLVYHAEVVALNRGSHCLKDRDLGRGPTAATNDRMNAKVVSFRMPPPTDQISISNAGWTELLPTSPHTLRTRLRAACRAHSLIYGNQ